MLAYHATNNPRGSAVEALEDGISVKIFFFSLSLSLSSHSARVGLRYERSLLVRLRPESNEEQTQIRLVAKYR